MLIFSLFQRVAKFWESGIFPELQKRVINPGEIIDKTLEHYYTFMNISPGHIMGLVWLYMIFNSIAIIIVIFELFRKNCQHTKIQSSLDIRN